MWFKLPRIFSGTGETPIVGFHGERRTPVCRVDSTMEQELMVIRAETLAIQAVLASVFFELKLLDPTLADAIARGFDNAANHIEDRAIQAAKAVSSETLVKALSITEDLRTLVSERGGHAAD
jgi:hypothetical protein